MILEEGRVACTQPPNVLVGFSGLGGLEITSEAASLGIRGSGLGCSEELVGLCDGLVQGYPTNVLPYTFLVTTSSW